jgi:hypothetical protein
VFPDELLERRGDVGWVERAAVGVGEYQAGVQPDGAVGQADLALAAAVGAQEGDRVGVQGDGALSGVGLEAVNSWSQPTPGRARVARGPLGAGSLRKAVSWSSTPRCQQ